MIESSMCESTRRSNGGVVVALRNIIAYTDRAGNVERVLEVKDEDRDTLDKIQETAVKMDETGDSLADEQRAFTRISVSGNTYFRVPGDVRTAGQSTRRRAYHFSESTGEGDRSEVSARSRVGAENQDRSTGYGGDEQLSLPSDNILNAQIQHYLAACLGDYDLLTVIY